jgi:hypothetical protein
MKPPFYRQTPHALRQLLGILNGKIFSAIEKPDDLNRVSKHWKIAAYFFQTLEATALRHRFFSASLFGLWQKKAHR